MFVCLYFSVVKNKRKEVTKQNQPNNIDRILKKESLLLETRQDKKKIETKYYYIPTSIYFSEMSCEIGFHNYCALNRDLDLQ